MNVERCSSDQMRWYPSEGAADVHDTGKAAGHMHRDRTCATKYPASDVSSLPEVVRIA